MARALAAPAGRWGGDIRAHAGTSSDAATATRGDAVRRPVLVDVDHLLTGGVRQAQAPLGSGAVLSEVGSISAGPRHSPCSRTTGPVTSVFERSRRVGVRAN